MKINFNITTQMAARIVAMAMGLALAAQGELLARDSQGVQVAELCPTPAAEVVDGEVLASERRDSVVQSEFKFYFNISSSTFDLEFGQNAQELARLDAIINSENNVTTASELHLIDIFASASVDGLEHNNLKLAQRRAQAIKNLLVQRYSEVESSDITTNAIAEDWVAFRAAVEANGSIPHRAELLKVIDDERRTLDNKEWVIRTMHNGQTWDYLKENIFEELRYSSPVVIQYRRILGEIAGGDSLKAKISDFKYELPDVDFSFQRSIYTAVEEYEMKPLLALKTNMLFDAVTLLNAEIEFPIGDRFSVLGEWIGPWWVFDNGQSDSQRSRIQAMVGTLEGRYWLGADRTTQPALTGFFVGAYGTLGSYDFEFQKKGVQSKDLVSYGLTAGYAHTINKSGSLRLEYSLGLGVMTSTYKEYTAEFVDGQWWKAYRDATKSLTWFGPTRAKVSLVWMINYKKRK